MVPDSPGGAEDPDWTPATPEKTQLAEDTALDAEHTDDMAADKVGRVQGAL